MRSIRRKDFPPPPLVESYEKTGGKKFVKGLKLRFRGKTLNKKVFAFLIRVGGGKNPDKLKNKVPCAYPVFLCKR